jgi:hypothetical protein
MHEPGDTVYTLSTSREGVTVRRGTVRYVDHRDGVDDDGARYERTVYGVRFDGDRPGELPYPIDESALIDVSRYAVRPTTQIGGAVIDALEALTGPVTVAPADPLPVPTEVLPPPPGFDAASFGRDDPEF